MSNGAPQPPFPPAPAPPAYTPGPRRRSIFAGILLILLGILFLISNLTGEYRFWRWFADFWPVLLILWGLAKLFDFFAARRTGEPVPRALGGGEFFLLLLLLLLGGSISGLYWVQRHHPDIDISFGPFERRFSYTEEISKPAKADALISINTDRGDITVHPEDTAEIRVIAKKTVGSLGEEDAKRRAQSVGVVIQEVQGGYEIAPRVDSDSQMGVRLDLEVHVPKQASIRAKTERGAIQVSGVKGPVTLNAGGDVEVRETGGDVTADLTRGDLRILGAQGSVRVTGRGGEIEVADVAGLASIQGEFTGPIRLRNVTKAAQFISRRTDLNVSALPGRLELGGGALELHDVTGSVTLDTRDKDIVFDNVTGRIQVKNRRGNIELRFTQPPGEPVEVTNDSGSIELVLPAKSTFELFATSRSGEVENDFRDEGLKATQDERASTLQGKVGARGPQIHVETTYGTVRLRKIG